MHFVSSVPIVKFNGNSLNEAIDDVISEERVVFYLNGDRIISTMCLPQNQDSHIIGFLMSEGVIENIDDVIDIQISKDGLSVFVNAKINETNIANLYHEKTLTSGCCVGISANFDGKIISKFVSSKNCISLSKLREYVEFFDSKTELFYRTGCVHKVVLICDSKIIEMEDIGRHNALDKAVGKARLLRLDMSKAVLFVSGRLSMEMVIKCAMHDVAIVVSKSATTMLGVKSAHKMGITLIGFARDGVFNIYTHSSRISPK